MKRLVGWCLVTLWLSGCGSTGVGHLNPEFPQYRLGTTAVYVLDSSEFGTELESRVVAALNEHGVKAFGVADMARFAKSKDELLAKVLARGAKDVLNVSFGDASASGVAGYTMSGTATTVGNTTYANGTAVPVRTIARQMQMYAVLLAPDYTKIWEANTTKNGRGLLFTGGGAMTSGSVDALLEAMQDGGLID